MLSVREIRESDISLLCDYWMNSGHDFMRGMGVDVTKIPARETFAAMLMEQIHQTYENKKSYCIIWEKDGIPVGHSNVSKIIYGEEAYMHLHLWETGTRQKGWGAAFIQLTIPFFIDNLKLKKLFCEPYALNPAPNKTLPKAGFVFLKSYTCTPGWINFEQPVNLWLYQPSLP